MDNGMFWLLAVVPLTVIVSFTIHWLTLVGIDSAERRLPQCRGAYLGLSAQLVAYAWLIALVLRPARTATLLAAGGMTLSFVGDAFNLQFDAVRKRVGEPLFYGILAFAAAQLLYIAAFLSLVPLETLVSSGWFIPLLAALVIVPAVLFRLRVYNPERPVSIMRAAFGYGFILGAMAAVALAAAIARGGYWYLVAAGALCFLLSDAVMGETTMYGRHPKTEFQIPWLTYLAAQGLILLGLALT
jgi:hypothetical protein